MGQANLYQINQYSLVAFKNTIFGVVPGGQDEPRWGDVAPGPTSGTQPPPCWASTLRVGVLCRVVVREIRVDYNKCTGCKLCIEYCPVRVLEDRGDGKPRPKKTSACIACVGCMAVCEPGAIEVVSDWECSG